jgi:DNA polymerase elongation subunit (family B)
MNGTTSPPKTQFVLDVECYENLFHVAVMDVASGKHKGFTKFNDEQWYSQTLSELLTHPDTEFVTFNGKNYDMPMIALALEGASNKDLKAASDDIIQNGLFPWEFYRKYDVLEPTQIDHIDLIEVAPGMASLKIYGGRIHTQKMQDLPIEPDAVLTGDDDLDTVKFYCVNDLRVTRDLAQELAPQIQLRRDMSAMYDVDLRSKSDAQIAEAVLKAEYEKATGKQATKFKVDYTTFHYEPPAYIKFRNEPLKDMLKDVTSALMEINPTTGHVIMPEQIKDRTVTIGHSTYKLGIGGLHSQEKEVSYVSQRLTWKGEEKVYIIDRDVVSYYPNLMLNGDLYPASFGDQFQPIYRDILERRVEAKRDGDMVTSNALKITLNGTFGKTSNQYSLLYTPKMMIYTTLTGQLSLLMLIEMLEEYGIQVVSANTDGFVMLVPESEYEDVNYIVARWEKHCGLETEETFYQYLYSRDVNNYIAITTDMKVKTKGAYASSGLMKNPQNEVCIEAVKEYLLNDTPCAQTIFDCKDITKFLTVRTVKGGAYKEGFTLGKAIRWYYSTAHKGEEITYKENGNAVPRTMGGRPCMDLPDEFPTDIDYDWYINECNEMLMDIGAVKRPELPKVPRKNSKEWKRLLAEDKIKPGKRPKDKYVWVME